ncbi:MAG: DUF3363 domain-containing protein, partial [Geminicoccaceae bacterium]|nr:DUF3363 domain-containing protein [Geminicoccaceae bacterium]
PSARGGASGADPVPDAASPLTKKRAAKAGGGETRTGSGTAGAFSLADRRQRCIVKVNYVRHGGAGGSRGGGAAPLRAHARYLERDGAGASDPFGQGYLTRHGQEMFGEDGKRLEEWQGDRHHFRLVISPEHSEKLDMQAFTTRFMQKLESRLYQSRSAMAPLEWAAVTHHNTDHPHAHVVLRGRTQDGRDLVIPKKVISHGLRELGRDLATNELGYRLRHDMTRDLARQARMERFTGLDRFLVSQARDIGGVRAIDPDSLGQHARARLDWLVDHGHATRTKDEGGSVVLDADLAGRLREKGEEHDIVRSLQRQQQQQGREDHAGDGNSPPIRRYRKNMEAPPLTGQIEHVELLDELTDRFGAVVRDATDKKWLVEISHGQADFLSAGDSVQISTTRTLPNGKTTRSPFIRIENIAPSKTPVAAVTKVLSAGMEGASPSSGKSRGMSLDMD